MKEKETQLQSTFSGGKKEKRKEKKIFSANACSLQYFNNQKAMANQQIIKKKNHMIQKIKVIANR